MSTFNTYEPVDAAPSATAEITLKPLRKASWGAAIGFALLIVLVGAVALIFVFPAGMFAALICCLVGGPYAVVFVISVIKKWRRVGELTLSIDDSGTVAEFLSLNQRLSVAINMLLLLNVVQIAVFLVIPADQQHAVLSPSLMGGGTAASAGAVALFILNLRWYREGRLAPTENAVLSARTGQWKWIRASRVLSILVWGIYGACGLAVIIGILIQIIAELSSLLRP